MFCYEMGHNCLFYRDASLCEQKCSNPWVNTEKKMFLEMGNTGKRKLHIETRRTKCCHESWLYRSSRRLELHIISTSNCLIGSGNFIGTMTELSKSIKASFIDLYVHRTLAVKFCASLISTYIQFLLRCRSISPCFSCLVPAKWTLNLKFV